MLKKMIITEKNLIFEDIYFFKFHENGTNFDQISMCFLQKSKILNLLDTFAVSKVISFLNLLVNSFQKIYRGSMANMS